MIDLSKHQRRDEYDFEQLLKDLRAQGVEPRPMPEPAYDCPVCHDLKWVNRDVPVGHPDFGKSFPCPRCNEAQLIQSRINNLLRDVPRLARYENLSLESFITRCKGNTAGKEEAIDATAILARGEFPVDADGFRYFGLLLIGPYGVGKTGLGALALFERLRTGISAACADWQRFADSIQDTYNVKKRDMGEDAPTKFELLRAMIDVDFLMIDELGHYDQAGRPEIESPDRRRILESLIAGRHSRMNCHTLITSNLSLPELRTAFGEYVVQRLLEMCLLVNVGGVSLRNQQGQSK